MNLGVLCAANFVLAIAGSAFLLGQAKWLGDDWSERLKEIGPRFLLGFCFVHFALLVVAWQAHRRLLPKETEKRMNLIVGAAFLPPQALRLRAQLSVAYFSPVHPLAFLALSLNGEDLKCYARQLLGDLNWPLPLPEAPQSALINSITSWMRGRLTLEVDRLLREKGLATEKLLQPPPRDSDSSKSYCPRCGSQFMAGPTHCPEGIKLLALK